MNLTELEEAVLAYFLAIEAPQVSVDGRFYLRHDFVQIFRDKIYFSVPSVVRGREERHTPIANWLVDKLMESGALSTVHDNLGATTHQFQTVRYRAVIKELIESNEICQRAQQGGPQFWQETFAGLTKP